MAADYGELMIHDSETPWSAARYFSLAFLACALCWPVVSGCDNNSSGGEPGGPDDFFISPRSVTLGPGDTTATFSVSGGDEPMTWAVSDPGLGSVTATTGRLANYTRNGMTQGGNDISVTDAIGRISRVLVVQGGTLPSLGISPAQVTLTSSNEVVTLTARGGTPPVLWAVIDASLGTLSNTDQSAVNYRRNGAEEGQNIVELTDSNGTISTATVVQRGGN
jgi:hypothetical protein